MIRVCIIGNSGHAATVTRALPRLPQVEIAGFCRAWDGEPMTEVLEDFARLGLSPKEYPDYRTMTEAEHPDVLVVDGLFCDHEDMTLYALASNIHVYCDKPLSLTLEGLKRIEQAASQSSAVLWAMQTARYDPWFYTAKCLIDEGAIGDIRLLSARKSYRLGQRAPFFRERALHGGLIPWVAIHGIDFIRFLYPKAVQQVFASHSTLPGGGSGELEVSAQLMLTMEFLRQDGLKGLLVLRLIELLINLTEQPGLACFLQHRFPLRRIGAFGVQQGRGQTGGRLIHQGTHQFA